MRSEVGRRLPLTEREKVGENIFRLYLNIRTFCKELVTGGKKRWEGNKQAGQSGKGVAEIIWFGYVIQEGGTSNGQRQRRIPRVSQRGKGGYPRSGQVGHHRLGIQGMREPLGVERDVHKVGVPGHPSLPQPFLPPEND